MAVLAIEHIQQHFAGDYLKRWNCLFKFIILVPHKVQKKSSQ